MEGIKTYVPLTLYNYYQWLDAVDCANRMLCMHCPPICTYK